MDSLCSFCEAIRFSVLGFHGPMFHPNSPLDSDDSDYRQRRRDTSWQNARRIQLTSILDRQETCVFCRSLVQLFEDRLADQDTIPKLLTELGAAGAEVSVGYRTEPACRRDLPDWELTRLEIALKLPEPILEALRTKFGVSSHLDFLGPNVFIVLQSADNEHATMEDSIECRGDFANWGTADDDEEYGFGVRGADYLGEGRIRPCVFDAEIVPYWRELCEEKHEVHRESPCWKQETSIEDRVLGLQIFDPERVSGMRVIDVWKKCVVDYDWNGWQPYYALSYVWGTKRFLTLNKANEKELRKEGSLSRAVLPDTIADAMEVVDNMDGRYLWVDSLCILQDCDVDKKRFINRMGTIYRAADMTIIALCGEDAYAGLPGVRKDRSRIRQQKITIDDVSMLPVMMPTGWAETYKLGETKWTTRAWTHQETLLSRRRLVFGREQAYFICGQSILCEDVIGPGFSPFIDTFALLQLYALIQPNSGSLQKHFAKILTAYTKRELTQRIDRLNGISGIIENLSKIGGRFFQGIPSSCFSNAILWDRDFLWTGWPRVIDERSCQEEEELRVQGLPSWSWVGWMGYIRFAKDFDDEPMNGRLRFYGYTPDEGLAELENSEQAYAQKKAWGSYSGASQMPRAYLPREFWDFERTEVKLEDLPSLTAETPLLCFWTSSATIELRANGRKNCFKTKTGNTVSLGLRIFVPPGEVKSLELIVLGDQSYIQIEGTPAVAVIAIRWENSIAYREPYGLETISYRNWKEIEGVCWKRIIMG
ncbi:HET-domain-containing protein [Cladorrhinum sp. PSN259]|nr:HET-domain-containing protein [Cladorrhinum sp. PSN259]